MGRLGGIPRSPRFHRILREWAGCWSRVLYDGAAPMGSLIPSLPPNLQLRSGNGNAVGDSPGGQTADCKK